MSPYREHAVDARNLLICAGLDPTGGAGILADASNARALGVRPVGVVTALTIQDTTGVRAIQPVDAELVRDQLEALLSDVEVHAVKIGMIGSVQIARALAKALELTHTEIVWDPVMHPTRGTGWESGEGGDSFADAFELLGGQVRLLTPNAQELAAIAGREIADLDDAVAAAQQIYARHSCVVLVKGGHFGHEGDSYATDVLVDDEQTRIVAPRIPHGEDVHGTGCALSTAIAAELAKGAAVIDAVRTAKKFVHERIAKPVRPGRGAAAVV